MSAAHLHNQIFTQYRDPSDIYSPPPHLRNPSSVSNGTAQTHTSESYPVRPLLENNSYSAGSRSDQLAAKRSKRQSSSTWAQQADLRRQVSRLIAFRFLLDGISAIWGSYNAVRYFIAYIDHTSGAGQAASLVLGICAAVSSCLTITASLLFLSRPNLAMNGAPVKVLLAMDTFLHWFSSILLFAPALANFIFVLAWHHSSEPDIAINPRCSVDADIAWTLPGETCDGNTSWAAWLALAVVRLLLTSALLVALHIVLLHYDRIRYPTLRFKASRSKFSDKNSVVLTGDPYWTTAPVLTQPRPRERRPSHHSSSTDESYGQPRYYYHGSTSAYSSHGSRPDVEGTEVDHFADRFRSLVTEISRETDAAVDLARSDPSLRHSDSSYDSDDEHSYDYRDHEHERPYHPPPMMDEHVEVFGTYVRRLSTIESMGSREQSLYTNTDIRSVEGRSMRSRPPTMSFATDSNPPSRANSLNAENMLARQAGAGEHGEIGIKLKTQAAGTNGSATTAGGGSYYTADGSLGNTSPDSENFPSRF